MPQADPPYGVIFHETEIPGAYVIEPERQADERGFFARTWDRDEFGKRGLMGQLAHCSISFNPRRGTLRGMHFQEPPFEEAKLVRCSRGAIYDVAVDLRAGSPTSRRWVGVELSAENGLGLYVPEGCAHGFLTLEDDTEVSYQISEVYAPAHARGVRYDDPAFGITWPGEVVVINDRDRSYGDFERASAEAS